MPDLSVVIPTYNGAARLRRCLESLHRQTLTPENFEVVVAVDGATDDTVRMLASINTPFHLVVIEQRNQGAAAARNAGVAAARGTYCVFVDDDIVAAPELLAEHLRVQRAQGGLVGLGAIPTVVPVDAGWLPRCFAEDYNAHLAKLANGVRAPSWRDCYGGNVSVARASFLAVGGFAPEMRRGHDVELGYRLFQHGLSFVYVPTAVGTQELSKDTREIVADFERYGVNAVEIYRRHPWALTEAIQNFDRPGSVPVWVHRVLLATGISVRILGAVGSLLRGRRHWTQAWYGFVKNHCYWYGVRRSLADPESWWQLTHSTPILSYRGIRRVDGPAERRLVSVRGFARQMAWLKWAGYSVLSLEEYVRYRREYRLPPKQSVVITIEDSGSDTFSLAEPVLRRYGYPTTAAFADGAAVCSNNLENKHELSGRFMRNGVNNHKTPPHAFSLTEIRGSDSLLQFAWKVWHASSSTPNYKKRRSLAHAIQRRILQVSR